MFRAVLILIFSLPGLAHAHGLNLSLTDGSDAISGRVTFADGAPLAGAAVELRQATAIGAAPKSAVTQTNSEGRYAFPAPDKAGEYRVIADDGLGHRAEIVFVAHGDHRRLETTRPQSPWFQWLSGLGYLAGLFGITTWWLSRRSKTQIGAS